MNNFFLATELSAIYDFKSYAYKELRNATEDFGPANKIGEGSVGSVYKVSSHLLF